MAVAGNCSAGWWLLLAAALSCSSPRQYDPGKYGTGGGAGATIAAGGVTGSGGRVAVVGFGGSGLGGAVAVGGHPADGAGGNGGIGGGSGGNAGRAGDNHGCGDAQHNCAGVCVANESTEHCGVLCDPCVSPSDGVATCEGGKCDFTCVAPMKKCGAKCAAGCCGDGDCTSQSGMAGQCDTSTNTCSYSCASGFKPCGAGHCIPAGDCCSQSDCPGSCQACSNGSCVAVINGDDSDSCAGTCDGKGICKAKQGQTCQTGLGCIAGSTCAPDGYCCNNACTNSCQACDIPGFLGVCTSVASGPPHGNRVTCSGSGTTCGGVCANRPDGMCSYPSSTSACGAAKACSGGATSGGGSCSGGGQCVSPAPMSCPNGCNSTGTDCLACGVGSLACNGICCSPGQSCCGGLCVDTSSNPAMCGSSCTICPTSDRATATCTNGMCGTSCAGGAPKCTDGSCSRSSWTFDSADLDGITVTSAALAVRSFGGNMALAVGTTNLQLVNVGVTVPICRTGTVDLSAKTLRFRAYFDGTPMYSLDQPANFFLIAYVPGPTSGFLGLQSVYQGIWNTYSAPINMSSSSATTAQVTIAVGSFGGQFSGTVWIDDIEMY